MKSKYLCLYTFNHTFKSSWCWADVYHACWFFYLVLLFHEKASILACGRWIPTILAAHAVGWLLFLAALIFLRGP